MASLTRPSELADPMRVPAATDFGLRTVLIIGLILSLSDTTQLRLVGTSTGPLPDSVNAPHYEMADFVSPWQGLEGVPVSGVEMSRFGSSFPVSGLTSRSVSHRKRPHVLTLESRSAGVAGCDGPLSVVVSLPVALCHSRVCEARWTFSDLRTSLRKFRRGRGEGASDD